MSNTDLIILDALESAVHEEIEKGTLAAEVLDGVPRPHVFTLEAGEYWDEDDVAAIKAVGDADVLARIHYYRQVLDALACEQLARLQGDPDE